MKSTVNMSYLLLLCFTAALGGLLFGFDVAIISGAGPALEKYFKLEEIGLGIAFSSLLFGCALGALGAGFLADRFGRKVPLMVVAALFGLTSLATGLAPDFTTFLIARFLGGLAVGGVSILTPMYIAEIAPPTMRGRLCTGYQLAIVIGILGSFLLNYILNGLPSWDWFNSHIHDLGTWDWRWMFISGVLPSLFFLILLFFFPETPRFLFKVGREQEAAAVLTRIVGEAEAERETVEIRASLVSTQSVWTQLTSASLRRPLLVGFCLAVLIHFSGINTIIDYAPKIFQSAGFSLDTALFSTFGIGLTNFTFTLVSFWIIDRYGRKPLYIIGSIGLTVALSALGVTVMIGHFSGLIVLMLILGYVAFFAACIGPVFWTLVPEIFPNRIRGEAMIVPVLVQWIANAIAVMLFPLAFKVIGKEFTFFFLATMAFLQVIFTWKFVPETKGKTLEEIEDLWGNEQK